MSKTSLQEEEGRVPDGGLSHTPGLLHPSDSFVTVGENFLTVGDDMDTSRSVSRRSSIHVERPVFTQDKFDTDYPYQQRHVKTAKERLKGAASKCTCSARCVRDTVVGFLPFIGIMRQYNLKTDLLSDLIAGLTVGIMQIPQGMAYALLANVPPVVGLYVSLFPAFVYFFLGTSRQVSVGTFAVISLMVGAAVDKSSCASSSTAAPPTSAPENSTGNGTSFIEEFSVGWNEEDKCKIAVATAVTLFAGIFQILMGVLRLGFITTYLSEPLTRGFTTGCSMHVFTSQVRTIFGLSKTDVPRHSGAFKLIKTYIDIFKSITRTNFAALITSAVCIIVLVLTKELLNPIIKAKIKMPFPIELLVVIGGTLASYYGKFNANYNMTVVGFIPKGIPPPSVPPVDQFGSVFADSLIIAIVAFAISVSMAKIFAKKHDYEIDANQELYAHGVANAASCFFNCFTSCVSLSRSVVQDDVGGKTQIASVFASGLIIIVLFFLGPLFEPLPNCVLAAIIMVALKGMFMQFKDLKRLAGISWIDFAIWSVAFLATAILDVDLGLIVGLGFCLLSVVFRTQSPHVCLLGWVPQTDIYKDMEVYPAAKELPGLKIFRMEASLYYANSEYFLKKLYGKTIDPKKLVQARDKAEKEANRRAKIDKEMKDPTALDVGRESLEVEEGSTFTTGNSVRFIIIDCTTMGYVDSVGVSTLQQVIAEYKKAGIEVYLAGCKAGVREMLDRCDFYDKNEKGILYLSIHDAVLGTLADQPALLAKPAKQEDPSKTGIDTGFINTSKLHHPQQLGGSTRSHDKHSANRKRLKVSWLRPLGFKRESSRHLGHVEGDGDLAPLLTDPDRLGDRRAQGQQKEVGESSPGKVFTLDNNRAYAPKYEDVSNSTKM